MTSGKVKCTCGWSWNKSDSSKKDMYICHECGRDNSNNMKNGGWLDSYADGGTMQEHQENYNDSEVSLPEGFVGMGNNTKGRNYSPAWGGQFEEGGEIPIAQNGKLTFLQPTSDKLPEGYVIPYNTPSSELAMSIGGEDGEPAYLIPSFKYGKPLTDPIEEFRNTGEHLGGPFKTWQEADKWENETRHPAVEKKENIMFPQEQFQTGGSFPGAVGFSYARTQSPAPSNGKYAKKTMASAQNGKEMKYYQEGLDFKPKTISQNGDWLDKFQEEHPSVRSIQNDVMNRKIQEHKGKGKETAFTKKDNTRTVTPKVDTTKPLTKEQVEARKLTEELKQNIATNEETALQERKDQVFKSMQEFYKSPLGSPGYFTPEGIAIGALQGAFKMPGHIAEGDYKGAAIDALMALPIGIPAAKGLGRALGTEEGLINNLSKSRTLNELKGSLVGIPPEKALPRLSSEELKIYRQVQDIGRMRATGKPISQQYKYALEQGIPEKHLQQIFNKSKSEIESIIPNAQEEEAFRLANPFRERISLQRPPRRTSTSDQMIDVMNSSPEQLSDFASQVGMTEDELVNFARSSMSQQTRSDVIRHTLSDYDIDRVTNQLNPIPEEFILNTGSTRGRTLISGQRPGMTLGESFNVKNTYAQRDIYNTIQSTKNKIVAGSQNYPYYEGPVLENVPSLSLSSSGSLKNVSNKVAGQSASNIGSGDIFTGSLNTSHSSYLPQLKQVFKYGEGAPQFLGYKPMNQMGFLSDYHYPSKDIAKYLNTEIDTQISRGVIPKDIQRPYVKGEKVLLPHYGIKQFEEGGIIKDDRGQWGEHKGEPTRINQSKPGSYIDMGPDPLTGEPLTEPLLGISDKGEKKMMYPGEKHKFKKGTKYVDEYPKGKLAQNGLRQEQKGLQNLDQLTNFTNYNTKQPGGWLDKY